MTARAAGHHWHLPAPMTALWRVVSISLTTCLLMASLMTSPAVLARQETTAETTPDTALPSTNSDRSSTAQDNGTPEANSPGSTTGDNTPESSSSSNQSASSAVASGTEPGSPAVLAQGLAFQSGANVVWQVREVSVPDNASAQPEASDAALVLQREGSSIIRNDVTGKRALIGPGEGYFKAANDSYTTSAEGGSSTLWLFEVVDEKDVDDDNFYYSPVIDDYKEGTYDLQLTRYILQPGDQVEVPQHTGTALLMATSGEIDVEDDRGLLILAAEQGQLMAGSGTVTNSGSTPVEYVIAAFGTPVEDTTAANPDPGAASDETPAASTSQSSGTTSSDTATQAPSDQSQTTTGSASGAYVASINITAGADIYVTVTADDAVVFDGPIPAGGSSGTIVGSVFQVYTSSGANTQFTDACGNDFYMGFAEGEENYTLTADANSCAP